MAEHDEATTTSVNGSMLLFTILQSTVTTLMRWIRNRNTPFVSDNSRPCLFANSCKSVNYANRLRTMRFTETR